MERDDLHHDPDEEFEEYNDYREHEEEDSLREEFDAEPLRLVDKLLSLAPEKDPARPLLYGLRRQLMEREITRSAWDVRDEEERGEDREGAVEKSRHDADRQHGQDGLAVLALVAPRPALLQSGSAIVQGRWDQDISESDPVAMEHDSGACPSRGEAPPAPAGTHIVDVRKLIGVPGDGHTSRPTR